MHIIKLNNERIFEGHQVWLQVEELIFNGYNIPNSPYLTLKWHKPKTIVT
jgi:hypothetical protein